METNRTLLRPFGLDRMDALVLLLAAVLLLGSAWPWISELGMEYDEAHFLESATRIVAGYPERPQPGEGLYLFHRPFLFMTMSYVGALDGWLMAIPLKLFGFHQSVSRLANLAAGFLVLLLAYALAKHWGGPRAALLTIGLLLVDLEFLLHVPVHFGPFFLQILCAIGMVWSMDRWLADDRPRWFYAACLLAGLAFQEKLTFVWVLAVYVAALLLFRGREVWARLTIPRFLAGFGLFLLAMLPVLVYTASYPEIVFGYGKSAARPAVTLALLGERFSQWQHLLQGQLFLQQQLGAPGVERFSALAALFWAGLAGAVLLRHRTALMLFAMTIGLILLNALFPDGGRLHHYLLIYPFPQIAIALVAAERRGLAVVALLAVAATGVSTARNLTWYAAEIHRGGGRGHWSSAIYDLAAWVKSQPDKRYLTTAWGLSRQLYTLTGGTMSIRERYFELLPDPLGPELKTQAEALLRRRDSYWISSNIQPHFARNLRRLFEIAAGLGLEPRLVKRFAQRSGEPIYDVYSFFPQAERPWRRLPDALPPANVTRLELPPGVTEIRFRVPDGHSARADALVVEFLDRDGQRLQAWWRTLEHFPLIWSSQWLDFGPDLSPDYFDVLPGARAGEPRFLQVTVESRQGPQLIRPADIEVR